MIDLPDHGYVNRTITPVDAGGVAQGSLGGADDYIDRPGYRYSIQFELPPIPSAKEARMFEALLEQCSRSDASYPWPLDQKACVAGLPVVDGSNSPGATLKLRGLTVGCVIRVGQPLAVIGADGTGYVHKATAQAIADNTGRTTVGVFPLTRTTFTDGLTVEVERPRIRGQLNWQGSQQGPFGRRSFSFTITERR